MRTFLLQALAGFLFWTIALTPYMVFIVKTTWKQYMKWMLMELILIPPLAPLSVWFINWFVKVI